MDPCWAPDPPGTINPAKLATKPAAEPHAPFEVLNTPCLPLLPDTQSAVQATCQSAPLPAPTPPIPRSPVPLPRITSDWVAHDAVSCENRRYPEIRREFEEFYAATKRTRSLRTKRTSHEGYFRSQMEGGARIHVPVDPGAGPSA